MSSAEETRAVEARGSRNGRSLLAGRDNSIFTQSRRNQRAPPKQEFFTESTNTSYIPSPSPVRSTGFAKPRQALNNAARALNGAHRATFADRDTDKENENVDSTPANPQERSRSRASSTKRSPVHISAEGSPQPITRATTSDRTAARTPSPRGREERPSLVSPASFVSESSEPPQALPEIYRRIEDEELIAGAGSDVSSSVKGSPEQTRIKRLSLSPAGERNTSAQRASPQLQAQAVEIRKLAARSPRSSSPGTSASSPFEETVETDPEMLARDERRVREAIASDTRAFAKARKGKASLTLENLRRQEATREPKDSSGSQTQSSGQRSEEPGVNVPSTWGTKAKRDRRWLESIMKDRQAAPAETAVAHVNGINAPDESHKAAKSVKDWLNGATASPIVELEEPEKDSRPEEPKHPLRERTSLEKARQWENDRRKDTLSPPRTTTTLAALRERSIERLEKSAVASNRLGALGDTRTLQKRARKTSSQYQPEAAEASSEMPATMQAPKGTDSKRSGSDNESNATTSRPQATSSYGIIPPVIRPDSPVTPDVARQLAFAAASQPKGALDSHDLLRRFTRASSRSPVGNSRASHSGSSRSDVSDSRKPSPLSFQVGPINKPPIASKEHEPQSKPSIVGMDVEEPDDEPSSSSFIPKSRSATTKLSSVASAPKLFGKADNEGLFGRQDVVSKSSTAIEAGSGPAAVESSSTQLAKERDGTISANPDEHSLKLSAKEVRTSNEETGPGVAALPEVKEEHVSATPQMPNKGPYLKTPKVSGAWIDTPIATAKKLGIIPEDISDPAEEYDEQSLLEAAKVVLGTDKASRVGPALKRKTKRDLEHLAQTAPDLPHSALAAIIDHAKRKNRGEEASEGEETLQLDEGTIRSLEQLLVKDEKDSHISKGIPEGPEDLETLTKASSATDNKPTAKPASQTNRSKSSQTGMRATSDPLPASSRAKSALKPALSLAIQDSPKVSKNKKPKKSVAVIAPSETCDQAGEFHDFIWPCDACRARARAAITAEDEQIGVVQWQTIQIPRLWTWNRGAWLPRPTRLGWWILMIYSCVVAERFVASYYTPPFYALKMEGFGVDYDMVRPPFVIPKLIWRGPAGGAVRWVWWLLKAIVEFIAGVLGIDLSSFQKPPAPKPKIQYTFTPAYVTSGGYYDDDDRPFGADPVIQHGYWG